MHQNSKLLLGLCLLLLSDKAWCECELSNFKLDRELLVNQLLSNIDQLYGEIKLHCPSNVVDEVKICVLESASKGEDDNCKVLETSGLCNKAGILQCEGGAEYWRSHGPNLNKFRYFKVCYGLSEVEQRLSFSQRKLVFIVVATAVICAVYKVIAITIRVWLNRRERLLENPELGEHPVEADYMNILRSNIKQGQPT